MVDVTPLIKQGAQIIQSYAGGQFRVSGQSYDSAIIVTAEETRVWDGVSNVEALTFKDFQPIIDMAAQYDVFLLGTGGKMIFLPPELKKQLKEAGIHIETMGTGAACRTYNVLMAEGRRIMAALL